MTDLLRRLHRLPRIPVLVLGVALVSLAAREAGAADRPRHASGTAEGGRGRGARQAYPPPTYGGGGVNVSLAE